MFLAALVLVGVGFPRRAEQGLLRCPVWASRGCDVSGRSPRAPGGLGFSNCGLWAELPHGMWDLPGPGSESVRPALAGGSYPLDHHGTPASRYSGVTIITYLSVSNVKTSLCFLGILKEVFYSLSVQIFFKVVAFYSYLEKL